MPTETQHTNQKKTSERVALVTGASRGIGREIALELAKNNIHIIALARTVGGLEELDDEIVAAGGHATLVPLDLKDLEAIDRLGGVIFERWGHLDYLAANAGILGALSPLTHVKPKTFDDVMTINLTANFRLIRALDPLLRASEDASALFVTSSAARRAHPYWAPYGTSKLALEHMVRTWAAETMSENLRINVFNPGATATKMRAQAMPGEDQKTLPNAQSVGQYAAKVMLDHTINRTYQSFTHKTGVSFEGE